jgi:hypothetical protein
MRKQKKYLTMAYSSMVEHSLGVGVLQPQDQGDDVGSTPAMPSNKLTAKLQANRLRTDSKPAGNKGFAIAGVPSFADTFVQGGSSVLRMKFSAKTSRHRKPPKR